MIIETNIEKLPKTIKKNGVKLFWKRVGQSWVSFFVSACIIAAPILIAVLMGNIMNNIVLFGISAFFALSLLLYLVFYKVHQMFIVAQNDMIADYYLESDVKNFLNENKLVLDNNEKDKLRDVMERAVGMQRENDYKASELKPLSIKKTARNRPETIVLKKNITTTNEWYFDFIGLD